MSTRNTHTLHTCTQAGTRTGIYIHTYTHTRTSHLMHIAREHAQRTHRTGADMHVRSIGHAHDTIRAQCLLQDCHYRM